ncbi:MAG: bi-domain-containing oxidoreductase [Acidimicrobiales bacterium]
MKQVVQPLSGGAVRVMDVPRPVAGATEALVRTRVSLISAGTERALASLAQSNLLAKARARPDLVRQVVRKARADGVRDTVAAVRGRLGGDLPLGYSACGVVEEVGEAVLGVAPGSLVATGSAGHAEYQAVPGLLCAPVPEGVEPGQAAFATIGSIALHGFRLAGVDAGSTVAVIGLGLVGQMASRLALAAGCRVVGLDVAPLPLERATAAGVLALHDESEATTEAVRRWAGHGGVDAVLVAAGDRSSQILQRAPGLCRDRATIVVVGDVGMDLSRRDLYEKELSVRVSRSYGPGRYERSYEEWGVDYPAGQVRWTEGRNQAAVLDLLARGRLVVDDLITHRFHIDDAAAAYRLIEERSEPYLGVLVEYPADARPEVPVRLSDSRAGSGEPGVGMIGAGAFASGVLVPALRDAGFCRFVSVTSASGLTARRVGERTGFEQAVSGVDAVIADPEVEVVVIASTHNSHGALATQALEAGKSVWCEKPLALNVEELDAVGEALRRGGGVLFVGFNRRFSPAVARVREHFAGGAGPLVITYRVSAGPVSAGHWYGDRRQGGRLLGEVCHFVDTCAAIAGNVVDVVAFGSTGGELLLADDFVVALRHADGSLSTISYAAGGDSGVEKERVEVLGRGHSAVISDYRSVILDGKPEKGGRQDKGHRAAVAAFREAVLAGDPSRSVGFESSRVVLAAAASLGRRESGDGA